MSISLKLDNLSVGYGRKAVVSAIAASIDTPMLVALIGPNGAGKSTLLRTITGELKPLSGDVYLNNDLLRNYSRKALSRVMALVSTSAEPSAGGLRVEELVSLGRQPYTGFFGRLSDADHVAVECAMQSVGISHKRGCYVANLSDGERQKTMIARALAQDTPVICLDEPFSFLDPAARIDILLMLRNQTRQHAKLIIFSTHDVAQALRMADTIWLISDDGHFSRTNAGDAHLPEIVAGIFQVPGVRFSTEINDFVPSNQLDSPVFNIHTMHSAK